MGPFYSIGLGRHLGGLLGGHRSGSFFFTKNDTFRVQRKVYVIENYAHGRIYKRQDNMPGQAAIQAFDSYRVLSDETE